MNFAPALSTVCCHGCAREFRAEQLNENGHCLSCRVDLAIAVEAEQSLDRLFDGFEPIANIDIARVVARAQGRAQLLHPTTYSVRASRLDRVIGESMVKARQLLGDKKFGVAS